MLWPEACVMHLLIDIQSGQEIDAPDGVLTVRRETRRGPVKVEYAAAELDALEERGWIVIGEGGPTLTEQGLYALEKYSRQRFKLNINARTLRPAGKLW